MREIIQILTEEIMYIFTKTSDVWKYAGKVHIDSSGGNNVNVSRYDSLLVASNFGSTQIYELHDGIWEAGELLVPQKASVATYENDVLIAYPDNIDFFQRDGDTWQKTSFESSPNYYQKVILKENMAIIGDYTIGQHRGAIKFFNKIDDWEMQESLLYWDAKAGYNFAYDIDVSDKYLIAGAPAIYHNYDDYSNSIYIFMLENGEWTLDEKLSIVDTSLFSLYGSSVAISNSYAVVGSSLDNEFGERAGAAYLYKKTLSGWTLKAKLIASDIQAGDQFGYNVEITENNDILISSYEAQSIYYFRP